MKIFKLDYVYNMHASISQDKLHSMGNTAVTRQCNRGNNGGK